MLSNIFMLYIVSNNIGSVGRDVLVRGSPHVGRRTVCVVRARGFPVRSTTTSGLVVVVSTLAQAHAAASSMPYYTAKGNIY